MRNAFRDARYGLRVLARKPGFAIVAVLTLALGIGANTAIFSVTHGLLLKPLPYHAPDELVLVRENNLARGWTSFSVSPANFLDWRSESTAFRQLAAFATWSYTYSGGGTPEHLRAFAGTEGFLEMLDGTPLLGRGFSAADFEAGRDHVAILNHGFWQRAFGGRDAVVGDTIVLNGEPFAVVGVLAPGWRLGGTIDVFVPRAFDADERQVRGSHYLNVIGRLAPDTTLERADREMGALAARLAEQYPTSNAGWGVTMTSLYEAAVGDVRPMLVVLFGAVGFVLLMACANLANMHLSRATDRGREIAIRTAVGASRGRIVSQLLIESLTLALAGGAAGLLLAAWATSAFVAAYPTLLPRASEITLDGSVLAFTAGLSILAALLFGLSPAVSATRRDLTPGLRAGIRSGAHPGARWTRGVLAASEVALALVLLTGAGLLIRSFVHLARIDPGIAIENRLAVTTLLPPSTYAEPARAVDFYERASERIAALPGVRSVALTSLVPVTGDDEIYSIAFEGRPDLPPGQGVSALYYLVGPGYFETMGIPLLEGRTFTDADRAGATPVAIVNDGFVRLHYPNENPIGQRIHVGRDASVTREIVGVVGSVKQYGLADPQQAQMYEPFHQMPKTAMTFVIESAGDRAALTAAVRREIQAVDPDQPIEGAHSLEEVLAASTALPRVRTMLLGAFAGLALLLASVGLYGVMSYSVAQRTAEFGIRMTLGASRGTLLRMILRQAFLLIGAGLAAGLAGALLLGRVLASVLEPLLFQVRPDDAFTLAAVALGLTAVALIASIVPAQRATRVDPIRALRSS